MNSVNFLLRWQVILPLGQNQSLGAERKLWFHICMFVMFCICACKYSLIALEHDASGLSQACLM